MTIECSQCRLRGGALIPINFERTKWEKMWSKQNVVSNLQTFIRKNTPKESDVLKIRENLHVDYNFPE